MSQPAAASSPPPPAGPCGQYFHQHPPVQNADAVYERQRTPGEIIADKVADTVGSWPFIIIQSILLVVWMALNVTLAILAHTHPNLVRAWDPYPFILLNLVLSFQAAYTGPIVMMSQNRQEDRDRVSADLDHQVNQTAEEEVKIIMQHLMYQDARIEQLTAQLDRMEQLLQAKSSPVPPPG